MMMAKRVALAGAWAMAVATTVWTAPAAADVKAGVDAWSRGDYAHAITEWQPAATAGDADAQFNLGQAYKLGRGVPADLAQATEWFRRAAVQGHAQAGDNYALALFQAGDKAAALPWLEKSAARDEKRTELILGTMLFNGDAVTRDWPRAYALVTRSSQQGLAQARTTLTQMDGYVPAAQRQQGLMLAKVIEAQGRTAAIGRPAPPSLPPTPPAATAQVAAPPPARAATSRPAAGRAGTVPAPLPSTTPTRPTPAPAAIPVSAPVSSGGPWAVQLGAFRDPGNARDMWAQKGARVGGSPAYVKAGTLTKLLAVGFASKSQAQAACARVGSCLVTKR